MGMIFLMAIFGAFGIKKYLLEDSFFIKARVIGSDAWLEEKMKTYPELSWLADKDVRKTHDTQGFLETEEKSPSLRRFGQKYPEFDRSILSLMALDWFAEGSRTSYEAFVGTPPGEGQEKAQRLSWKSFHALHLRYQKTIREGVPLKDLEIALILGDMGKTQKARTYFKPLGVEAADHDDFLKEALQKDPSIFPSFANLSPWTQKTLLQISGVIHFGHVYHLEGGIEMIQPLIVSNILHNNPRALEFDFLVHLADLSGAAGHINSMSSLVLTENTYKALMALDRALQGLKKKRFTASDVLKKYIKVRAGWLGLDAQTPEGRVLTRMGVMTRLFEKKEGRILKSAFKKFDENDQVQFVKDFDPLSSHLPKITPTYMPAVFVNLFGNKSLGATVSERLSKTLQLGLPFVSRALDAYIELLQEGKVQNTRAPLNFNDIARVAKENPMALEMGQVHIDSDNGVHILEGSTEKKEQEA